MQEFDKLQIQFDSSERILLNIILGILMFGVALDLKWSDFRKIIKAPKAILVGLLSQLVLLPLITILVARSFNVPSSIQMGLLLVAVCPGGNISNYYVHRANGNAALSITLTSIVTTAAFLITPLNFVLWLEALPAVRNNDLVFSINFWEMFLIVVQLVFIPLLIGLSVSKYAPKVKQYIYKPVRVLSLLLLLGIIVFAMIGNKEIVQFYLKHVLLIVAVHNGLAFAVGYFTARLANLTHNDAIAISIETGIQNGGLALILILTFFNGLGGMALIAAWWGVWDIFSGFLLSSAWQKQAASMKNTLSDS